MESNNDMFYNDRRSEKNFVDWAYDKIAEEMKRIEELEGYIDAHNRAVIARVDFLGDGAKA